jgi:hypothetical protein
MNWTGGRLKRHYQANSNRAVKSQKQDFAKARLRLQDGPGAVDPPAFSIFPTTSVVQTRGLPRLKSGDNRVSTPEACQGNLINAPAYTETIQGAWPANKSAFTSNNEPSKHIPVSDRAETFDSIKRKLLQNPDWAGLSIVKPVSYTFPTAREMEGIGRRRKVTKDEHRRKRQAQLQQQAVHYNIIRPIHNRQSQSLTNPVEPPDLSIRMGSNIHQTNTTQTSKPGHADSPAQISATASSVPLDNFERCPDVKTVEPTAMITFPPLQNGCHDFDRPSDADLLPLNEALDLKNFDEVRARSSSLVQNRERSSTPYDNSVSELSSRKCSNFTQERVPGSSNTQSNQVFHGRTQIVPSPPRFTLDQQVVLEREANYRRRERQTDPKSVLTSTSHSHLQETRGSSGRATVDAQQSMHSQSSHQHTPSQQSWIAKFKCAKEEHQRSLGQETGAGHSLPASSNRLGDENEAWMKYVFPEDFGRMQKDFAFGHAPTLKGQDQTSAFSVLHGEVHHSSSSGPDRDPKPLSASPMLSRLSVPSAANATIFDARRDIVAPYAHSETDFLSRFSPMEGVLDERLVDISVYNNAAATDHSFISLPQAKPELYQARLQTSVQQTIPAKRKAMYNLEDLVQISSSDSRPNSHKAALKPLARSHGSRPRKLSLTR